MAAVLIRLLAAACMMAAAPASARDAEIVSLHGRTMGTTYNIKLWRGDSGGPAPPELQRSIDALLMQIDKQMSTWRPDSELSLFNAAPAGQWRDVSRDTAKVVNRALELHRISGGASDVTVGPLSRLWGFGPGAVEGSDEPHAPSAADIREARDRVGAEKVQVRLDPPHLRKDTDRLEIDLSSIAPGYAVDRIIDLLAANGVENAMVELGGEMRGVGARPGGEPWRAGVQSPPPAEHHIAQVLPLRNLALATSGDFHHVRTVDGVAYAHIIDPRTGRPLQYRGACVTVVAETCFEADGLATALFVMGVDGYSWCVEHEVAALFQEPGDDGGPAVPRPTPRFAELFEP